MKEYILYCRQKINSDLLIFSLFFSLYVLLGMIISYNITFDSNIFFGADNARAFNDLTKIDYNHYRIKVHPLLLFFVQPVVSLFNGILNNITMSLILTQALTGSLAVYIFFRILKILKLDNVYCVIFSLLYGFSFSVIMFSSIPETFIFAGFGLNLYWFFILLASQKTGKLSNIEKFLIIFFGVLSFGITLTNYVTYFIGLCYLLYCRFYTNQGFKTIFLELIKINLINLFAVLFLCAFQAAIWPRCPHFLTSIVEGLLGVNKYEEIGYMNFEFSSQKTLVLIQQTLLFSFFSPNMSLIEKANGYKPILFTSYENMLINFVSILFIFGVFVLIFWKIKAFLKNNENIKEKMLYISLLLTLVFNLCLHYIYGSREAFMYTPHFIYIFLLLGAMAVASIPNKKIRNTIIYILIAILFFQIINNITAFLNTAKIALSIKNMEITYITAFKGFLLSFLMFILGFMTYNWISFTTNFCQGNKQVFPEKRSLNAQKTNFDSCEKSINTMFNLVLVYIVFVAVICISIGFNY